MTLLMLRGALGAVLLSSSAVRLPTATLAATTPPSQVASPWLVADVAHHRVTLTIIADYNNANGGLNFNGYARGKMKIVVPRGYRVVVAYTSQGPFAHNVLITGNNPTTTSGFTPAFPGSGPSDTVDGVEALHLSFVARAAGAYYLVCGVPGHAAAGMWDRFVVAASGTPAVSIP